MTLNHRYGLIRKIVDAALLMCLSLGALYAGARIGLVPQDPAHGVAVVFSPWTSASQTLSQATAGGGSFVRYGGLPFIAVVIPDDATYTDRMFGAGAWLVVDPEALAACASALSVARENS
jgi:hypothetical protein